MTVLEASAGTGKTFTIAALATRYVAAGVPLEQLLVVTFTRMATGELRERVRDRLVSAERGLARAVAGIPPDPGDTVLGLLAAGARPEVEERRRRLAAALADFDAATIATTHGFCQHVLSGLGVLGDVEPDLVVTEAVDDLLEEVVDDLYVRRFWRQGGAPFNRKEALRIARAAIDNPGAPIDPEEGDESRPWAMRRRLAMAVRTELDSRKRQAGVLTYDDLLVRLKATLSDGARGAAACERLRARYRVALVDEFQDTDPDQWDILQRAFGDGASTLVLIGDPKQAIYAFRGADVYAYLEAARAASGRATLGINFRSDQALIDAYDALFGGARLGHSGIAYRPVQAAPANQEPGLRGAPVGAALRVRMVARGDGLVPLTRYGYLSRTPSQELVAADLAGDVVRLLSSGAEVVVERGAAERWEAVSPGHLAVLVRTHRQAAMVRDALDRHGVQAVINGAGSVFATPVAREWLRLLEALERPTAPARARSAALTVFLGWDAARVAGAGDDDWEDIHTRLHRWAGVLRRRGVASLLELISSVEGLPERVLRRAGGERELTDLRHLGQLLHAAATTEQMGPSALTTWLRQRVTDAASENDDEERSRRLESDAEAVQVLTIHRAKGLEFPVVYCPYLWDPGYIPDEAPPVFHDPDRADIRVVDVGGVGSPAYARHWDQYVAELRGEDLRLAYVALTRARHQAVLWWAGSFDSRHSPLGRLLFFRDEEGNVAASGRRDVTDDQALAGLQALAARAPFRVAVETAGAETGERWVPPAADAPALAASLLGRDLDTRWRRTSYTGLTHAAHEPRVGSEPEQERPSLADEPPVELPEPESPSAPSAEEAALRGMPCPLAFLAKGADVGTFVHRVLETVDFACPDLVDELSRAVAQGRGAHHLGPGGAADLATGLVSSLETPLGPLADGRRLRDFTVDDRLDELGFELPLGGGDDAPADGTTVTVADVAALLDKHLPVTDPLVGYPARLPEAVLAQDLRGYLTGSIDLVLRARPSAGPARYLVVDYKTNWLGTARSAEAGAGTLTAWDYRPEALAEAMQRAHYPLQALLYSVALHRYLRWRANGYVPAQNLGGVLYLFLRGMVGATAPTVGGQPCGVFSWAPAPGLVEALSDLLDGRGR